MRVLQPVPGLHHSRALRYPADCPSPHAVPGEELDGRLDRGHGRRPGATADKQL